MDWCSDATFVNVGEHQQMKATSMLLNLLHTLKLWVKCEQRGSFVTVIYKCEARFTYSAHIPMWEHICNIMWGYIHICEPIILCEPTNVSVYTNVSLHIQMWGHIYKRRPIFINKRKGVSTFETDGTT